MSRTRHLIISRKQHIFLWMNPVQWRIRTVNQVVKMTKQRQKTQISANMTLSDFFFFEAEGCGTSAAPPALCGTCWSRGSPRYDHGMFHLLVCHRNVQQKLLFSSVLGFICNSALFYYLIKQPHLYVFKLRDPLQQKWLTVHLARPDKTVKFCWYWKCVKSVMSLVFLFFYTLKENKLMISTINISLYPQCHTVSMAHLLSVIPVCHQRDVWTKVAIDQMSGIDLSGRHWYQQNCWRN